MSKLFKSMLAGMLAVALCLAGSPAPAEAAPQTLTNGTPWKDVNNASLQAHAGSILKVGSTYYWYGEDKIHNSANFKAVTVYSSTDLKNWTWQSYALTQASHSELQSAKIERPKVIYNESTGKYVLWGHYENGSDYSLARVAVATSSTPTGPFTYHGSFRPNNNESRDMTIFKDTDGTAYLISSSDNNYNLRIYRLTSDYLGIDAELNMIYEGDHREAPAIVKKGSIYYLITSGASGWYPNQAMYSTATSLNGPWSALQPLGNSSTFYSQSAFILTVQGSGATNYIYVGDRWNPGALGDSRYVWLPLTLNGTTAAMDYYDQISIDAATGAVSGVSNGTLLSQGKPATAQSALAANPAGFANDGSYQTEWVGTSVTWPHWWKVDLGSVQQINNVQISWWMMKGSEGFYQYRIETSTDNVNWSVALDRTGNTTYGFTSDTFSAHARYVRINMVNADLWNNPGNWYTPRIWEVKVYGQQADAARWQSHNFPTRYIANDGGAAKIVDNPTAANSEWIMVPGLADPAGVSFVLKSNPSVYLRHYNYVLQAQSGSGSTFAADATFYKVAGLADGGKASFRSYNFPTRYIRHSNNILRIDPISTATEKSDATFAEQ
ncbi:AbfB domain-containing protein [Paenibacillus soyae]|uniref:AbfB domain-containing protein n=1 Tax=Paenibacillus soyae TaxID=2969249 RepID=A0A9X2ML41_9BACL|nr:AbfB domain-containing protein [Paenibacillus soyae]MCR2802305.1 AbfB domain-containing protein [Paenibacillus soyae]